MEYIQRASFHLDSPHSKGVFIVSYKEKKPFLINDIKEIGNNLSRRSLAFAHQMGTQSFICCPIICDGKSIGVLAVDNLRSKRPLVQSDLSLLMGIASVIGISISNADLLEARQRQFGSILQVLAASIDARDPLTAGHSEKVTDYALGICDELNLSSNYREMIRVASLLHDYGKIGVPDSILKKPGRLTQEEYEKVKTHAEKTQKILEQVNFEGIFSQVPEIAGSHHEKVDGSGYPNGLKGEEIPLGARIMAVADFFEAVTAKRHYRDPLPMSYAFRLLKKGRGVHFDEKIVDAFLRFYNKEIKETNVYYPEKVIPMKKVC
jgi:HD-GYP domain-containing protein (c-di-GMP phosphodiesterase class II)